MVFTLFLETPPFKIVNSKTDYSTNVISLKYYCQFIILLSLKRYVIIMKITTCVWTKQFTINYHFIKGFIRNKRKKWIVTSFKRLKIFIMIRKKNIFSMTLKLEFDVRGNILFAFLSNKTLIMMMTIILEDSYLLCALEF